jgi:hypothetical protein
VIALYASLIFLVHMFLNMTVSSLLSLNRDATLGLSKLGINNMAPDGTTAGCSTTIKALDISLSAPAVFPYNGVIQSLGAGWPRPLRAPSITVNLPHEPHAKTPAHLDAGRSACCGAARDCRPPAD